MKTAQRLTFRSVLEVAAVAIAVEGDSFEINGKEISVEWDQGVAKIEIRTEDGLVVVFEQRPGRSTMSEQMARRGVKIIRIVHKGKLMRFGMMDGRYCSDVERECTRQVLR